MKIIEIKITDKFYKSLKRYMESNSIDDFGIVIEMIMQTNYYFGGIIDGIVKGIEGIEEKVKRDIKNERNNDENN